MPSLLRVILRSSGYRGVLERAVHPVPLCGSKLVQVSVNGGACLIARPPAATFEIPDDLVAGEHGLRDLVLRHVQQYSTGRSVAPARGNYLSTVTLLGRERRMVKVVPVGRVAGSVSLAAAAAVPPAAPAAPPIAAPRPPPKIAPRIRAGHRAAADPCGVVAAARATLAIDGFRHDGHFHSVVEHHGMEADAEAGGSLQLAAPLHHDDRTVDETAGGNRDAAGHHDVARDARPHVVLHLGAVRGDERIDLQPDHRIGRNHQFFGRRERRFDAGPTVRRIEVN